MKKLIIFLILCFACPVFSTPTINSISGTVSEGENIVISSTGTDFTTNDLNHEWLKENIEDGTAGTSFSETDWVLFPGNDITFDAQYSTTRAHSGDQSILCLYDADLSLSGDSVFTYQSSTDLTFVYVTYYIYYIMGESTNEAQNQWKALWITEYTASGTGSGTTEGLSTTNHYYPNLGVWNDQQYGVRDNGSVDTGSAGTTYVTESNWLTAGQWTRVELKIGYSSNKDVADGFLNVRYISDGTNTLVYDTDQLTTQSTGNDNPAWKQVVFGWYWTSTATTDTAAEIYFDDIYISRTQARVEIGNASTWAACTHREIQNPTAWSTSSITATVNQGSFETGTAYLYVVDENGLVNTDGFPIEFGAPAINDTQITGATSITGASIQ